MAHEAPTPVRRSFYRQLCIPLILLAAASTAAAQGSPPFLTDDPGTPGPKRWEIDVGLTLQSRPDEYLLETPSININYGIGKRIQLSYETSWSIAGVGGSTESGPGNSQFGVKWRFLDHPGAPLDVSIYPQFNFNPVSTQEFGLLDRDIELILPVQMEAYPGSFNVVFEIGYLADFTEIDSFKYGVVVGRSLGRVNIGAEIQGESDIDLSDNQLIINVGTTVDLARRHSLEAAVGASPLRGSSEDPKFTAYLGVEFRF
jgi:hypothetical protein